MMGAVERSLSEPPERLELNQKTGLRCGFPIKINGFALGSQDNLNQADDQPRFKLHSRYGSGPIPTSSSSSVSLERRRSLRGSTPVKIGGVAFNRSPSPTNDECSTPFGPVSGKRSHPGRFGQKRSLGSNTSETDKNNRIPLKQDMNSQNVFSDCRSFGQSDTNQGVKQKHQGMFKNESRQGDNVCQTFTSDDDFSGFNAEVQTKTLANFEEINTYQSVTEETKETPSSQSVVETFSKTEGSWSSGSFLFQRPSHYSSHSNLLGQTIQLPSSPKGGSSSRGGQQIVQDINDCGGGLRTGLEKTQGDISPNKLKHAISNMTVKLESFKSHVKDDARMDQVDQALQNMKDTLRSLGGQPDSSSLEDVILNMKDTLSSIRSEVNYKTLLDLNREMTPFDLPALSPLPQSAQARKVKKFSVHDEMERDLVKVETIDSSTPEMTPALSTQGLDGDRLSGHAVPGAQVDLQHNGTPNGHAVEGSRADLQHNGTPNGHAVEGSRADLQLNGALNGNAMKGSRADLQHNGALNGYAREGVRVKYKVHATVTLHDKDTHSSLNQTHCNQPDILVSHQNSENQINGDSLYHRQNGESDQNENYRIYEDHAEHDYHEYQNDKFIVKDNHKEIVCYNNDENLFGEDLNSNDANVNIKNQSDQTKYTKEENFEHVVDNIRLEFENLGIVKNFGIIPDEGTQGCFDGRHTSSDQGWSSKFIPNHTQVEECLAELEAVSNQSPGSQLEAVSHQSPGSQLQSPGHPGSQLKSPGPPGSQLQSPGPPGSQRSETNIDQSDLEYFQLNKYRTENKSEGPLAQEDTDSCIETTDEASTNISDNESETETIADDSDPETVDTFKQTIQDASIDKEEKFSLLLQNASKSSIFLTDFSSENESYSVNYTFDKKAKDAKRARNRTIDLHDLHSLFWEGTVRDYHERQYAVTQTAVAHQDQLPGLDGQHPGGPAGQEPGGELSGLLHHTTVKENHVEMAKDGLGLILNRLKNIELKLDELKTIETSILAHDSRRHSLPGRISAMPEDTLNLTNLSSFPSDFQGELTRTPTGEDLIEQAEDEVQGDEVVVGGESAKVYCSEGGESSACSTPTIRQSKTQGVEELGYESDATLNHESDCDVVIDEKSDNDNGDENPSRWTYKPFGLDISEMSDLSESEDEDTESRRKRIESMALAFAEKHEAEEPPPPAKPAKRADLNMDIDTLSERSEEEGEEERERRPQRTRRVSGRKRSMSRERNVGKIRYCWRCHHAGHENWECQEDLQPGGWCPRCLESSHWEDGCWVEEAGVLCPICNIPGHLPCVHQATDFRQRKLVIDTFGWLAFKEWFQDLTFRSWWNCSGFTGVPLYKIMQRNPAQDLDLGFQQ